MDFEDSPEEAKFREQARSWLAENAFRKSELKGNDPIERLRPWIKRKYDAGWSCIGWPKQYGGQDASPIQEVIWGQEEARYRYLQSMRFDVGMSMVAPTLMHYLKDRPEVLERLLPAIASGEEIWAQLFSEPAGGSDLAALRTKAVRDGSEWVVNGQKIWSSCATDAKWGILMTRTDPTLAKHKGLTFFYVDMGSPGIEVRPIKQINGDDEFNEVFFTDVRIPDAQRIGEVNQGWGVALTVLFHERIGQGAVDFGVEYEGLCKLAKEIHIDGKPAIENAQVRAKLADYYCVEAGLRATHYRTISAISKGKQPGPETSIGKMVNGRNIQDTSAFFLDLIEQAGIVYDASARESGEPSEVFLSIPALRIAGGTDEIQANVIAESVLGLPGEARVDKNIPFNEIPASK